jgi:hypothetical protein
MQRIEKVTPFEKKNHFFLKSQYLLAFQLQKKTEIANKMILNKVSL